MGSHILIIDDDPSFRRLLEVRVRSFMSDAVITSFADLGSVREYLQKNTPHHFDLVILDQNLPDGSGVELLEEGWFEDLAVLAVSSDDAPEIPGRTLRAGAAYFLSKVRVSEALFKPLVQGIIDRNKLQQEVARMRISSAIIDTVKTLVATLRHEVNNPLGAVLGAVYILRNQNANETERGEAASLVEMSGKRIKHVLDQLCDAVEVEPVSKAGHPVFHIPGDKPWESDM